MTAEEKLRMKLREDPWQAAPQAAPHRGCSVPAEGGKWQSMDTAPRDGSDVLFGYRRRRATIGYGLAGIVGWYCSEDDALLHEPEAWMPLPPPLGDR
jgi:hypothetical protein